MKENFNYFIEKNRETGETIYIEYEKIKGYKITPKTKKEDAISVNKIVFVNPSLSEKIIKKKIEHKIKYYLNILNTINDDSDNGDTIRKSLVDAERLKLMIINTYIKYLGNSYSSLTLKKMQVIIEGLRTKLYNINELNISNRGRKSR